MHRHGRWVMLALFATVAACAKGDERVDSVRAASADSAPGATIPTAEVPAVAPPKQHDSAVASAPPKATTPVASPAAPVGPTRPAAPRRIMAGSLDITSIGYDRGNPAAPVVVVEFSDFGCPYCAEFALQTFPALDSEYIATGKVLFKYVPFLVGTFRNSAEVTRAAECVGEQRAEQYWPMMTAVYGSQAGWKGRGSPDTLLLTLARSAHADSARFAMCYADRHTDARIKAGTDAADYVGVRVTPSFLVDQRPVQGALPLVEFRKLIDAALLLSRSRD